MGLLHLAAILVGNWGTEGDFHVGDKLGSPYPYYYTSVISHDIIPMLSYVRNSKCASKSLLYTWSNFKGVLKEQCSIWLAFHFTRWKRQR